MRFCLVIVTLMFVASAKDVDAGLITAIVKGQNYTSNLRVNLVNSGLTVEEITTYDASSLASYDAIIHYGNSFVDFLALEAYVRNGGTLIETPWFSYNFNPPESLLVLSNDGGFAAREVYPGVSVLAPDHELLSGVVFPPYAFLKRDQFDIGRQGSGSFLPGSVPVAEWAYGTKFVGTKELGTGSIVAINMHVITSDTAFEVIDQPWATQLFVNAINSAASDATVIPEPASLAVWSVCFAGLGLGAWKRRRKRDCL